MKRKTGCVGRAYDFLAQMEEAGDQFTLTDLATASGWAESTVGAYRTKKLSDLMEQQGNGWKAKGIQALTL